MDTKLKRIFADLYSQPQIISRSGKQLSLINGISNDEVEMVFDTIHNDASVLRTLEVGCAIGFSSLAITLALFGRTNSHHTIIDPFQTSQWDHAGIDLLEKHYINNFTLIERGSEFALPSLVEAKSQLFDLILIDGFHSFDHTILDMFYSLRLLRVGGYLVMDDTSWPAVAKAVAYFENLPWFKLCAIPKPASLSSVALNRIFEQRLLKKIAIRLFPTKTMQAINMTRYGTMAVLKMETAVDETYYRYHLF